MGARFVNIDRQTPMLLPPDMRDWVAKNDLIHFVIDAVETCDTKSAKVNGTGSGDAQYPPTMMLALLIYCYANRIFSSREIEKATYWHIGVRYICGGNRHPDHDTVAKFRRENEALLQSCFVSVLMLAKKMGACARIGTVSVDGTKIAARVSRDSNRNLTQLQVEMAELQKEVDEIMAKAKSAEVSESEQGSLAEQLQDNQTRREKLAHAKRELEERIQAEEEETKKRARGEGPEGEDKEPGEPDGRKRSRPTSKKVAAKLEKQVINLVDSESRLMADAHGGFKQAYNAQAVVETSGQQLILGVRLINENNDRRALDQTLQSVPEPFRKEIKMALADTGYDNAAEIAKVEAEMQITVLCPPQSKGAPKAGVSYRLNKRQQTQVEFAAQMRQRLESEANKKLYRRRSATVEPVFGVLKNVMGFTRFRLFGLIKSGIELLLVSTAYNLRKLAQLRAENALA
jgi:transposase